MKLFSRVSKPMRARLKTWRGLAKSDPFILKNRPLPAKFVIIEGPAWSSTYFIIHQIV